MKIRTIYFTTSTFTYGYNPQVNKDLYANIYIYIYIYMYIYIICILMDSGDKW